MSFKSHNLLAFLTAALAAAIPIFWLIYHSTSKDPADPGRGGAIGVALSLFYLVFARGGGSDAFKLLAHDLRVARARLGRAASIVTPADFDNLVNKIITANAIADRNSLVRDLSVAVASGIGTLIWGFGDKIAPYVPHFG